MLWLMHEDAHFKESRFLYFCRIIHEAFGIAGGFFFTLKQPLNAENVRILHY